jgi:hypothetical protein
MVRTSNGSRSLQVAAVPVGQTYLLGEFESTRRRRVGPGCCRKSEPSFATWKDMMKALITALALVTLISGPRSTRRAGFHSSRVRFPN